MNTPTGILRPNRDAVVAEVLDGEAILIDLTTGMYYSMDKIGCVLWTLVERGASVDEMIHHVSALYDASREQVEADVKRLVTELVQENLAVLGDGDDGAATVPEMRSAATSLPELSVVAPMPGERLRYEPPQLNAYRDMGALLALDPPLPGFTDLPWKDPR